MEPNRAKYIKLGLFIVTGLVVFIVAVFVIGSKQNLFTSTFRVNSIFENVSGLREGNSVRYAGINVGVVDKIQIKADKSVIVTMTLDNSVREFIKKDSRVSVNSEGLVGNKIATITSGGVNTTSVDNDEFIQSVKPIEVEDIIKSLNETGQNVQNMTMNLADIVGKVNQGKGTLGLLVNDESLYRNIDSTTNGFVKSTDQVNKILGKVSLTVDEASGNINKLTLRVQDVANQVADIVRKLNNDQGLVGTLVSDTIFAENIRQIIKNTNSTTKDLELGAYSLYQNMEALKHNFLFKGYFEDIGYFDKEDFEVSKEGIEARQRMLKQKEKELEKREQRIKELEKKVNSNSNTSGSKPR